MPVDVDFLSQSFGSAQKAAEPPPPSPPVTLVTEPDTDFLSRAFSQAPEMRTPDAALQFDPLGVFFRGLRATGNVAAGALEDVGFGAADILAGRQPSLENVRSALTTFEPTPAEQALAQEKGIGAGLTSGLVGAVKSAPTLAAGALISGVTK